MFKFDPSCIIQHKKLGNNKYSWVCPYKEDDNENKWVIKCIHAQDQEEVDTIVKNIFFNARSHSNSNITPIFGYDVQLSELGYHNIYIKMPRMQESLRNVIEKQQYSNNQNSQISLDYIVRLLYSLGRTLEGLAQKDIFHHNLKPTNILLNQQGDVFVSDLSLVQPSSKKEQKQLMKKDDHDLVYIAPETFSEIWIHNPENLQKSDVWSLGMNILELCLIDKLKPVPLEGSVQNKQEVIEENLSLIGYLFGDILKEVLGDMLKIDPSQRKTFGQICRWLEQRFSAILGDLQEKADFQQNNQVAGSDNILLPIYDNESQYSFVKSVATDEKSLLHKTENSDLSPKTDDLEGLTTIKKNGYLKLENRVLNEGKVNGMKVWKGNKYWIIGAILLASLAFGTIALFSHQNQLIVSQHTKEDNSPHRTGEDDPLTPLIDTDDSDLEGLVFSEEYKKSPEEKYDEVVDYLDRKFRDDGIFASRDNGILSCVFNKANDNLALDEELTLKFMRTLIKAFTAKGILNLVENISVFLPEWRPISDKTLIEVAKYLASLTKLKKLGVTLGNDLFTNEGIKSFFDIIITKHPEIESLELHLCEARHFSDLSSITSLVLKGLPNLNDLSLELRTLAVTDEELEKFNSVLNENGKNLTSLFVWFLQAMDITSSGYYTFNSEFSRGLKNLESLRLYFNGAAVPDEAFKILADNLFKYCKNLKNLEFAIQGSVVSEYIGNYIKEKLSFIPKVEIYGDFQNDPPTPPLIDVDDSDLVGLMFSEEDKKSWKTKYDEVVDYLDRKFRNDGLFASHDNGILNCGWPTNSNKNVALNEELTLKFMRTLIKAFKAKGILNLVENISVSLGEWRPISDKTLIEVAKYLSQLIKLKKLGVLLGNDLFTNEGITSFFDIIITKHPEIESLELHLCEARHFSDLSSITSLAFKGLPNLSDLSFELRSLSVTYEDVENFNSVMNENGRNLKSLFIWFQGTPYGDRFYSEFGQGLENLENLRLFFDGVQVFDESMKILSDNLFNYCRNLKNLVFVLPSNNHVSEQTKSYIREKLSFIPKVEIY